MLLPQPEFWPTGLGGRNKEGDWKSLSVQLLVFSSAAAATT
jgi:hypothetical protein